MSTYTSKCPTGLITALLSILLSAPLWAKDFSQLSPTEMKEKWGQLIFCQRIYKLPEVKTRLYSFDVEQCDVAAQLIMDVISGYSEQNQVQLRNQAERHAIKLSYNTSEPYHSVGACREYCRELAEVRENHND